MSENQAVLRIEGNDIPLPIVQGTEGEKALMIAGLRQKSGYVTLDPSFMNTAACFSKITYVNGEKGILRYRGIPVEELVKVGSFVQTAYLLVHGDLPNAEQKANFSALLNQHSLSLNLCL